MMVDDVAISLLAIAYRDLSETLVALERADEFAAAAHVAAALDTIEAKIGKAPDARLEGGAHDASAVLALGMRDRFGERAEAVARRQMELASGPTLLAWARIVNFLAT